VRSAVEARGDRGTPTLEGEARLLNKRQKATARQLSLAAYLLSSDGRARNEVTILENLPLYSEIHASVLLRASCGDGA
jgi:hypothetical protein